MDDLNEHQTPPGGWQFRQPEINWSVKDPIACTLNQAVMQVVAQRKKNIALTAKFRWPTNPEAVKTEVLNFNRKRLGLQGAAPAPFPVSHSLPGASVVGAVADRVRRLTAGFGVLTDWLGEGGVPVAAELANKRAGVCAVCPKNQKGDFTAWFTVPASELIRKKLAKRQDLNLSTPSDEQLGVCEACLCPLKLKCHTPLEHVLKHMTGDVRKDLDPGCWILAEEKAPK